MFRVLALLGGSALLAALLGFSGVGGAPAALGQAVFPVLLLLTMGAVLLPLFWRR